MRCAFRSATLPLALRLGFGLMSTNDFILASFWSREHVADRLRSSFSNEVADSGYAWIWVAYCALPEPARKPVVMPANSTIYRWNEIAVGTGPRHQGCRTAAREQLLPYRCGEGCRQGADAQSARQRIEVVSGSSRIERPDSEGSAFSCAIGIQNAKRPRRRRGLLIFDESPLTRLRPARSKRSARGCHGQ